MKKVVNQPKQGDVTCQNRWIKEKQRLEWGLWKESGSLWI